MTIRSNNYSNGGATKMLAKKRLTLRPGISVVLWSLTMVALGAFCAHLWAAWAGVSVADYPLLRVLAVLPPLPAAIIAVTCLIIACKWGWSPALSWSEWRTSTQVEVIGGAIVFAAVLWQLGMPHRIAGLIEAFARFDLVTLVLAAIGIAAIAAGAWMCRREDWEICTRARSAASVRRTKPPGYGG